MLSYREECFEQIGLKPSLKIPLYNGSLECEFRKYQLFDGKMREFRQEGGTVKTDDEKRLMAERHRFKKNREFKERISQQEENEDSDIRSFTFHRHELPGEKRERPAGRGFKKTWDDNDGNGEHKDFKRRSGERGGSVRSGGHDRYDRQGGNRGGHERFDRQGDGRERFDRQGGKGGKKPFSKGTRKSFNHDNDN